MSNNEAVAAALAAAKGEAVKTADARTTSKRVAPAADKSGKVTQSAADAPVAERPVEAVAKEAAPKAAEIKPEELTVGDVFKPKGDAVVVVGDIGIPVNIEGTAPDGSPVLDKESSEHFEQTLTDTLAQSPPINVNHEPMDPADATEALVKAGVIVDDPKLMRDTVTLEPPLTDEERDAMAAEAFEPGYFSGGSGGGWVAMPQDEPAIKRLPPPTTGHHPTFNV